MLRAKPNSAFKTLKNQNGQILVEYLLLMVIAIACAAALTNKLIGRNGTEASNYSEAGIIIKQWHKIISIIGNDIPDCATQTNFSSAKCP